MCGEADRHIEVQTLMLNSLSLLLSSSQQLCLSDFSQEPEFQPQIQLSAACGAAGLAGSLMTAASLLPPAAVTDGLTALDE